MRSRRTCDFIAGKGRDAGRKGGGEGGAAVDKQGIRGDGSLGRGGGCWIEKTDAQREPLLHQVLSGGGGCRNSTGMNGQYGKVFLNGGPLRLGKRQGGLYLKEALGEKEGAWRSILENKKKLTMKVEASRFEGETEAWKEPLALLLGGERGGGGWGEKKILIRP